MLLLVLALMLVVPAAAEAGTAAVHGREFTYRAGAHERNTVRVTFAEDAMGIEVVDTAGARPGPSCEAVTRRRVSCTAFTGIDDAVLTLGDRDDRARMGLYPASYTAWLDGGSGDDVLISRARFRDIFVGGPGNDTMTGVAFAEIFDEGSRANGHDTISSDRPRGNPWTWVDYGKRARPIHADLDGKRDDGEAGERDLIGHGLTSIRGGEGADHLTGNGARNELVGGGGADVLIGGGEGDALVATDVPPPPLREPGVDVSQSPTSDRLLGGRGEDLLEGSAGANELDGGPGADRILGLAGSDRIRAQDGAVDRIECGAERDRAWNDVIDFPGRLRARCGCSARGGPDRRPLLLRREQVPGARGQADGWRTSASAAPSRRRAPAQSTSCSTAKSPVRDRSRSSHPTCTPTYGWRSPGRWPR